MPVLEKELAEALVHYRHEESNGVESVDIDKTRTLLRKWYDREHEIDKTDPILAHIGNLQAHAGRATVAPIATHITVLQDWLDREMRRRWAEQEQHLEGPDEFNRAHRAATA